MLFFCCWQNASNSTNISTFFLFFLAADKLAICVVDVNMHWSLWIRSFLGDEGEVPASVIYYHFCHHYLSLAKCHYIFFVVIIIYHQLFHVFCYYHHFSDSHISWIVFIFFINCIFPLTATAHLVSFYKWFMEIGLDHNLLLEFLSMLTTWTIIQQLRLLRF